MSPDNSIEVESIGKLYYLGGSRPHHAGLLGRARRFFDGEGRGDDESVRAVSEGRAFWALRDLSFSVRRGEVLGIIGRNGAGKSTLLKILSRITEPTSGRVSVRGRVVSLLEVGTGFHDELTGLENIYLNAAILGMSKAEIDRKLDAIVAFSGVERFLGTPVKHYSSGMRVRLGFSVAAHVEPDVLIIDEVLAVGDLAFQEKCLQRVDSLTQNSQRTVLFVSHSMNAVASLCPQVLLLDSGRLVARGDAGEIISRYNQASHQQDGRVNLRERRDRTGGGTLRFTGCHIEDEAGAVRQFVASGAGLRIVLEYETAEGFEGPSDLLVNIVFSNSKGQRVFATPSDVVLRTTGTIHGRGRFVCTIPELPLLPGNYDLDIACILNRELADKVIGAAVITVVEGDFYRTKRLPPVHYGDVLIRYDWIVDAPLDANWAESRRKPGSWSK